MGRVGKIRIHDSCLVSDKNLLLRRRRKKGGGKASTGHWGKQLSGFPRTPKRKGGVIAFLPFNSYMNLFLSTYPVRAEGRGARFTRVRGS